jgi:hypothetical protein
MPHDFKSWIRWKCALRPLASLPKRHVAPLPQSLRHRRPRYRLPARFAAHLRVAHV